MKYSEITLLGLDAEKIWIAAAGRICRGKAKVIEAGFCEIAILNILYVNNEYPGIMVTQAKRGSSQERET